MVREYLQLARAHTVPLEAVPAITGASLATGGLLNINVAVWGVFGMLYHLAGYSMNSLSDWEGGYDKEDKYKQHHPLNTGEISESRARFVVFGLFGVTLIYAIQLIYHGDNVLASALLITAGVVSGVAYNTIGKKTLLKPFFISGAHATVFAVPYMSSGGSDYTVLISGFILVFLWVFYQIAISGELKDITQKGERNLLRESGVHIWDYMYDENTPLKMIEVNKTVKHAGAALKVSTGFVSILILYHLGGSIKAAIAILLLALYSVTLNFVMLSAGRYSRKRRVRVMAEIEMVTIAMMCVVISPIVGYVGAAGLFLLSVIWVIAFNKIEWGTILAPEV